MYPRPSRFKPACAAAAAALMVVGPALACDLPASRPSHTDTSPRPDFDTARFARDVAQALGAQYMGYAVTLRGRGGNVIAQINHGYARTPCEAGGAKNFNGRTISPIGSVSKVLTAAVVIHRAEQLDSVSLDHPMQQYLPRRWRADLDESLEPVTLRHLLQHKGGFAKSGKTLWGHDFSFQERLSLGGEGYLVRAQDIAENASAPTCVPAPTAQRCYSNTSFGLWNFSAASLLPRRWQEIEDDYRQGEIDYESYLLVKVYGAYRDLVNQTLFEPVGATAGCNVYGDPQRGAFTYAGPNRETGTNREEPGSPCAIGGWFMSTAGLSAAVHRIVSTRDVIDANHAAMFLDNDDRLVFSSRPRTVDGRASSHNGSRWDGEATAEVIVFPNGYVAAAIANSKKTGNGPSLRKAVIDAYDAALGAS